MSVALSHRQRLAAIATGSAGNLIEWFDFYIYAVGFLIRPVGGWYFGRFADRHGRRAALVASVLMMGAGSLLIAVLPTHASIGAWAPALLLLARLLQGFKSVHRRHRQASGGSVRRHEHHGGTGKLCHRW